MLPWSVIATDFWPMDSTRSNKFVDVAGSVEQRIIRMQMKVGKFGHDTVNSRRYTESVHDRGPDCELDSLRKTRYKSHAGWRLKLRRKSVMRQTAEQKRCHPIAFDLYGNSEKILAIPFADGKIKRFLSLTRHSLVTHVQPKDLICRLRQCNAVSVECFKR